ncbi:hypothetical protein BU25DRAFT_413359 [Macroventuria anomochaeta]|uniref:Uncharacterized protein n=1 Tax=Macroventuria anomochaeta TaxID=301207 RepID=A0ACB6RTT6_9PLEO|nr:uncharacterized protein BU25DRAFT_413359 [Macroventuria anomochaeta]KAF2624820.1 hypothetical protein BU25DRAFT_413359 [Macroventuria anomochaeta]
MVSHHKVTYLPLLALTLLSTRTPYNSQPWAPSTPFSRKPPSSDGAAIAVASDGRQKKLATNVQAAGTEGAGGSVGASKLG